MLGGNDSGSWIWWHWVATHPGEIETRLYQHIVLTLLAVGIGIIIAFPLGIAAHRWRRLYGPTLAVTSGLYTLPSIALFGLMIPIFGLTRTTAIVPLVLYTLLLLVRNVVTGLDGVPAEVLDAADGMGMNGWQRLFRVELPLALPLIIEGLKIATVINIGTATIGSTVAAKGLGEVIIAGLINDNTAFILQGGLIVGLMAVLIYDGMEVIEHSVTRKIGLQPH